MELNSVYFRLVSDFDTTCDASTYNADNKFTYKYVKILVEYHELN